LVERIGSVLPESVESAGNPDPLPQEKPARKKQKKK
jgi:hypothetical protein